jgi:hypothetical protein
MQMLPAVGAEGWLPSGEVVDFMVLEKRMGNREDEEQAR